MMNINCIICSDLISQSENIYFTKCGHVFHYHCLAQWIERSKSCPQCRNKVTEKCINRVYFNFASGEGIVDDATTLQAKLDNANFQLRQKETEVKDKLDTIRTLEEKLNVNESLLKGTEKKLVTKETAILALKDQLEYCKVQSRETDRLRSENERLEKSLNTLNGLQKVLNATSEEVDHMLEHYTDVKILATFASSLKSALTQAEVKKNHMRSQLQATKTELASEKSLTTKLHAQVRQLQERLTNLEQKNQLLTSKRKIVDTSALDDSTEESPAKIRKANPSLDVHEPGSSAESHNISIRSLVKKIEQADSPYLQLKQGSGVGLTTLRIRNTLQAAPATLEPSEIVALQPSKRSLQSTSQGAPVKSTSKSSRQANSLSIFNTKPLNKSLDMFMDDMEVVRVRLETSYDGLGGHSKPDVFPVPLKKSPLKSFIPKITARHRLKNPNSTKTPDIGKFFEKIPQNR